MRRILFYLNVGAAVVNFSVILSGAANSITVLSLGLNVLAIGLLRDAR